MKAHRGRLPGGFPEGWPLPPEDEELLEAILARKQALRHELVILAHHYQRPEIVGVGDYRGDSFDLSRKAAATKARHIVFCGVHFMAESAAILAQPHQTVQIPDLHAGCLMADMAALEAVETAWEELAEVTSTAALIPIVYMNSEAALKAFCGSRGGLVCTSSNALAAFRWGLSRGEKIFFFPDRHLGRNTANRLGLAPADHVVWDPEAPLGGNRPEDIRRARLILWDGHCHVHTRFQVDHILAAREAYPEAKIVVHPECTAEVVALADASGSTGFIVNYVKEAPPGATIVIGTEINLVHRLALEYPDRRVLDLAYSLCPNMFKISPAKLLAILEHPGEHNVIAVPGEVQENARLALDRMLALRP
ncbi:MAG: quinolinate synthase NadA [Deltaproteobacteria bacterium]|nr:quinolinate synthase NadA [Deltaproteobacteria bacterium]